eukprot:g11097.t1
MARPHPHSEDVHNGHAHSHGDHSHGDHSHGDHSHSQHGPEEELSLAEDHHTEQPRRRARNPPPFSQTNLAEAQANQRKLKRATVFVGVFFMVEVAGGIWSGSLAIISDAAHLLADLSGFILAIVANEIASRPACDKLTYGPVRAEVLSALFSTVTILVLSILLVYSAIARIVAFSRGRGEEIDGEMMSFIALLGVLVNLVLLRIFGFDNPGHDHGHGHGHAHDDDGHDHDDDGHDHGHGHGHDHHDDHDEEEGVVAPESGGGTGERAPLVHSINGTGGARFRPAGDGGGGRDASISGSSSNPAVGADQYGSLVAEGGTAGAAARGGEAPVVKLKKEKNINMEAAVLHAVTDLVQSSGVLLAGLLIWYDPRLKWVDPIATLFFVALVVNSTRWLLKQAFNVLLEGVPDSIDYDQLRKRLSEIHGVTDLHCLHVWSLTLGRTVVSAHIRAIDPEHALAAAHEICEAMGVSHTTIQVQMDHGLPDGRLAPCVSTRSAPPAQHSLDSSTTDRMSTPGEDETRCAQLRDGLGEEIEQELGVLAESSDHEAEQGTGSPYRAHDAFKRCPPVTDLLATADGERAPESGTAALLQAALTGDVEVFTSVLRFFEDTLRNDQLTEALTATSGRGEGSLIAAAARGGSPAVFSAAVGLLDGEVLRVVAESWPYGRAVLVDAANQGLHDFNAVVKILEKHLDIDQAMNAVSYNHGGGKVTSFTAVAQRSSRYILQAWAEILSATLPPEIMTEACTTSFAACVKEPHLLQNLSVLFAYGAEVSSMDLVELARLVSLDQLKACFLGGLSLVDNPFPAGSHLSVAIENALDSASAAERRALSGLQETLDDVLVEVLERLPQAMEDFPGGVNGFAVVFEPEIAGTRGENYRGPVRLALSEKKWGQTFCASPLVFEYISHKFTAGLPDLKDTGNLLGKAAGAHSGSPAEGRDFLYSTQMVANSVLGRMMQGSGLMEWGSESIPRPRDWDRIWGGTLLPGAQFIAIGVLTRPKSYYKVPALRMLLDFCAHLLVLTLFTTVALEDHHRGVTLAEIVLKFYILAELVQGFIQREWDWLDMSAIFLLASATIANLFQKSGSVGRALFAVSAPLLFARLLFFGKIFKRQGVVIQAIGIMLDELAHFGLVLGVVMMGFSLGFFVLFVDELNYGDTWLDVFKAMLGEADVFEEYYEEELGEIAKLLLVVYLFVVSILLLNLLIAVLSTAHARIAKAQERAFTSSKIGFVKVYSGQVRKDFVPAPFNLVQLALWLPAVAIDRLCVRDGGRRLSADVARVVGVFFFWLVLGPLGFLAAWPLWVLSVPRRVRAVSRGAASSGVAWQILAVVMLHTIGVPFIMLGLWIKSGMELLLSFLKSMGAYLRGPVRGGAEIKTTPSSRFGLGDMVLDSNGFFCIKFWSFFVAFE